MGASELERRPDRAGMPVDPWDRMTGEPGHLYAWFTRYRMLGAGRDLDELVTELGDHPTKSELAGHRDRWSWDARAEAWDAHRVESLSARRRAARDVAAGQAVTVEMGAMRRAGEALADLPPEMVTARGAAELISAATTAQRWALGDPSEYRPAPVATSDPLAEIAHDAGAPMSVRVRAASALDRRDIAASAAETDRDVAEALAEALADADETTARRVSAALAGGPVPEPGSEDDDRPDLGAELDELMRGRE